MLKIESSSLQSFDLASVSEDYLPTEPILTSVAGQGYVPVPPNEIIEFEITEQQNLFISLSNLNSDLDIYLCRKKVGESEEIGKLAVAIPYTNSTNHGNEQETLFAQLPPDTYYLLLKDNSPTRSNVLKEYSGTLTFDSRTFDNNIATLPNDPLLNKQWYLFNTGVLSLSEDAMEDLADNGYMEMRESNGILPNADIRAPEAWRRNNSADDIIVAVIDGGIEVNHPDLQENIWKNKGEIPGNGIDDDNNGYTDDFEGWNFGTGNNNPRPTAPNKAHGTHVAGTIGATGNNGIGISGVAWDVQLMSASVEDPNSENGLINVNEALRYASKNGAHIANLSLGNNYKLNPAHVMTYMHANGTLTKNAPIEYKSILSETIKEFSVASEEDMLMVIAAGNEGRRINSLTKWQQMGDLDRSLSSYNFLSGFFDNALNVASSDGMNQLSPYTNTGLSIDLTAPGGNITSGQEYGVLSTLPLGLADTEIGDYGYMQGTSMATPVVSGAAALVKAVNPEFSANDVRQILIKSAWQNNLTKGIAGQNGLQLDLEAAIKLAESWQGKNSFYELQEGDESNNIMSSSPTNTWLKGHAGDDVLSGNKADDLIHGGAGKDVIIPGEGLDKINGGKGVDVIRYYHQDESPIARPDRIVPDENDLIDLSALDGKPGKAGIQKLKFIGSSDFSGKPGQLMAKSNGFFVDLDGDSYADFGALFTKELDFDIAKHHFIL